jgi:hypothetical protein
LKQREEEKQVHSQFAHAVERRKRKQSREMAKQKRKAQVPLANKK